MYTSEKIVLSLVLFFSSCSSIQIPFQNYFSFSDISWGHKNLISKEKDRNSGAQSIDFYQQHMSSVIASRCTMFPSCSRFAQVKIKRCGTIHGTLIAMSRYYQEPDTSKTSTKVTSHDNLILFYEYENNCNYW